MGLFNKLKEILFDEETVEIPVITKEEKREEERSIRELKRENRREPDKTVKNDDEVIIRKIETPKRVERNDDDLFEMPKLKDTNKETEVKLEPRKQPKTFTFPVFDDDEVKENKKEENFAASKVTQAEENETPKRKETQVRKPSGYTNAFDYSYGKYKGDYKSNRESSQAVLKTTLEAKEVRKNFTPSPIISPVYGVLNENYKKEDIVSKSEKKAGSRTPVLDLDSVRRKAYGTLEDEIELSLTQTHEVPVVEEPEYKDDDEGLSINDLLVDNTPEEVEPTIEEMDDTEMFDEIEENTVEVDYIPDEIEIDEPREEEKEVTPEPVEMIVEEPKLERKQIKNVRTYSDEVRDEVKKEKTKDINEPLGEEDLFDLIDSLYQGKGEE